MHPLARRTRNQIFGLVLLALGWCFTAVEVRAQDTVTGAFEGIVSDSQTGLALKGASVEITNRQTGVKFNLRTDYRGSFFLGLLLPGIYIVRVSMPGYEKKEVAPVF